MDLGGRGKRRELRGGVGGPSGAMLGAVHAPGGHQPVVRTVVARHRRGGLGLRAVRERRQRRDAAGGAPTAKPPRRRVSPTPRGSTSPRGSNTSAASSPPTPVDRSRAGAAASRASPRPAFDRGGEGVGSVERDRSWGAVSAGTHVTCGIVGAQRRLKCWGKALDYAPGSEYAAAFGEFGQVAGAADVATWGSIVAGGGDGAVTGRRRPRAVGRRGDGEAPRVRHRRAPSSGRAAPNGGANDSNALTDGPRRTRRSGERGVLGRREVTAKTRRRA